MTASAGRNVISFWGGFSVPRAYRDPRTDRRSAQCIGSRARWISASVCRVFFDRRPHFFTGALLLVLAVNNIYQRLTREKAIAAMESNSRFAVNKSILFDGTGNLDQKLHRFQLPTRLRASQALNGDIRQGAFRNPVAQQNREPRLHL